MATLKPGEKVRSDAGTVYTILKELSQGGNAISYAAQSDKGKVFLKQYISPTIRVPWYKAYVAYQQEMKRRVETHRFKDFSYRFLEFFEFERRYYQVFEFVDTGSSLEEVLLRCRERADLVSWEQRLIMAKVMMGGIHALHQASIVHSDLKPANIMLIPSADTSIAFRYRLKIIDMDFSLLADRQAPWHGDQGYMGTPGYMSPEHLRGEAPQQASDVFTCGLMLYELLAREGHPYRGDDWEAAILAYRAKVPTLLDHLPAPADNAQVADLLHRCLSPRAAERPTAETVLLTLNGRSAPSSAHAPGDQAAEAAPEKTGDKAPTAGQRRLVLRSASGVEVSIGIPMEIGTTMCRQFGADFHFWAEPQLQVERDDAGSWFVVPRPGTTNETLLNGKKISARARLSSGDVLAVGMEAKAIVKLPLTVGFRP